VKGSRRGGGGQMRGMLSIFLAHNYYRSPSPSGENVFFEAEAELLRDKGHTVLSMSDAVMILPTCHSRNELH
ncbi:MAG: hypothetical protein WCB11_25110, partial [Terriglobales bacterium]